MRASTLFAILPLAMAAPAPAAPAKRDFPAPLLVPRGGRAIPDKYIIRMKDGSISTALTSAISSIKAKSDYVFSGINGFAATLDLDELARLRNDPNVLEIEQDGKVTKFDIQSNATWGLSRISSQEPEGTDYTFESEAGEGTCAYIIDTGIDATHPEFEGRAKALKNFADDGEEVDLDGHGTHVAGTIGSATYGVAKKAKLFGVRVLDANGEGTYSGIIAGMEYVVKHATKYGKRNCPNGIVVNMSLGGGYAKTLNDASENLVKAGLFLAVAAGNEAQNAANVSPASARAACTVGATDEFDEFADFSNFGRVVDVLAPGVDIESTWINGETNTISGTSMASPHVAGLAAYFMSLGEKADGLCEFIARNGLKGVISGAPNGTTTTLINNGNL